MDREMFLIAGIVLALVIAVSAPFLASEYPDGLESAFFSAHGAKEMTGHELDEDAAALAEDIVAGITGNEFSFASLMPDCSIPGMGKAGEAVAILAGTLAIFGLAYGIARAASRPER
ncbi:MAG: PDGLE domain-containing protein [Methanomicrobiaceae archaeon]|uniref:Additional substrate-specific component nikn of nickel ecf transporter n=1 Tax=hydrocarbon metagenome TaxID=938273 RepID=A0A0W8FKD4_9ZZZZ|nr:PDGLE domain-containing protein [Methanomicrobiaceae archaeon]MDD5418503.1 PDGLE domain-containing protein [Methanomicrobiaceae archaeon]